MISLLCLIAKSHILVPDLRFAYYVQYHGENTTQYKNYLVCMIKMIKNDTPLIRTSMHIQRHPCTHVFVYLIYENIYTCLYVFANSFKELTLYSENEHVTVRLLPGSRSYISE